MKLLRYILSIPALFFTISFSYYFAGVVFSWVLNFKGYMLLTILVFFIGTIYSIYSVAIMYCIGIVSKLSPSYKFTYWVVMFSAFYTLINNLIVSWTHDIEYKGKILATAIMYSIICLYLTYSIIISLRILKDEDYSFGFNR